MVSSRYCWRKGKLVMESESAVSPRYDGEDTFQRYEHIETTCRGGKKRTHTICTDDFRTRRAAVSTRTV